MQEFKEYDMRRFSIKDYKDALIFIKVMQQMAPQIEALLKKMSMSAVSKDAVINNLEKKLAAERERFAAPASNNEQDDNPLVNTVDPIFAIDKDEILQKLQDANAAAKAAADNLELVEKETEELQQETDEVQVAAEEATSDTSFEDRAGEVYKDYSYFMLKGNPRWMLKGKMVRLADVPDDVKDHFGVK
jgi:hypothetical protein